MKLSSQNTKKLDAMIWRDRLWRWGLPVLAAVAAFAGFAYMANDRAQRADRGVDVHTLSATVVHLKRPPSKGMAIVSVRLADGREVDAASAVSDALVPGTKLVIVEQRRASGKLSHEVFKVEQ